MKFRHAMALIAMSQIIRSYWRTDLTGLPYATLVSLALSLISIGLCALVWRFIVGKDEW